MNRMAEQFKIKGKWLPSNKKSDMREEDHQGIIKALSALDNKQLECRSEGCEKEATSIITGFPFCSDCGLAYLKAKG